MRRAPIWLCLALVLAVAACGSPKTRFYELEPMAAGPVPAAAGLPPIVLRHVALPDTLDRLEIVTQGGDGTIAISGRDRWAGALDGMVQATLADDLQALLPGRVIAPGDPAPPDAIALAVNVRRFSADAAGRVVLVADWSLLAGKPPVAIASAVAVAGTSAASGKAKDAVPAMSAALATLGRDIAAAAAHAGGATP